MIDTSSMIQYMKDLSMNNNRECFHEHKQQYIEASMKKGLMFIIGPYFLKY